MEYSITTTVDCINDNCPMPLIKTRKAIMKSNKGDVIKVIGTHEDSFKEIPMALEAMNISIIDRGRENNHWYIVFRIEE